MEVPLSVPVPDQTFDLADYGKTWTPREQDRWWRGVASSADGSKLVAIGGNQIYTSTDSGVTWTPREQDRYWWGVASSADGSKLVAVELGGQIYTSTDSGETWTPREEIRNWHSVASSADGTKLVAVVYGGGHIYTSTDSGVTWTQREQNRWWLGVASSADGSKLVAIGENQIYTSTDSGVTWTPREQDRKWAGVASSADGTKLVAVEDGGQIYTSTDSGVTWTPREKNRDWQGVASSADGSKLVAVVNEGLIYTSTDSGVTWISREKDRNWGGVASSADGSKLVAVELGGQIYTSHATSLYNVKLIIPTTISSTPDVGDVPELKNKVENNFENKYLESSVIDKFIPNDKNDRNIEIKKDNNEINEINEISMNFTYFMKNIFPFSVFIILGAISCYAAGDSIENLVTLNKSNLAISWTVLASLITIALMVFVIIDYFEDQDWYLAQLTMSGDKLEVSRSKAHYERIYQKAYYDAWDEIMRQVDEADAQQNAASDTTRAMATPGAGAGTNNLPNLDNSSDTIKNTNKDHQTIFWLNSAKLRNTDVASADTTAETVNMENQIVTHIDKKNQ